MARTQEEAGPRLGRGPEGERLVDGALGDLLEGRSQSIHDELGVLLLGRSGRRAGSPAPEFVAAGARRVISTQPRLTASNREGSIVPGSACSSATVRGDGRGSCSSPSPRRGPRVLEDQLVTIRRDLVPVAQEQMHRAVWGSSRSTHFRSFPPMAVEQETLADPMRLKGRDQIGETCATVEGFRFISSGNRI